MPLVYSQPQYCTDNAAMIGWMGWELLNADQDVCIRDSIVNGIKKIPLGSYVEGLINTKTTALPGYKKVMTVKNFDRKVSDDTAKGKIKRHVVRERDATK